jgi:hypothetical protein
MSAGSHAMSDSTDDRGARCLEAVCEEDHDCERPSSPRQTALYPPKVLTTESLNDPFDLTRFRLDQSFTEMIGVKKLLTTVPVRKPGKQDFIRVHPDPNYRLDVALIVLKDQASGCAL